MWFRRNIMKKRMKKIIASISAAVLSVVPMMSAASPANAAGRLNTYRIYYDAQKTGIADFEVTFHYTDDIVAEPSAKTSLCENGIFNSIHYTISQQVVTTYQGDAITETGTLATTKFLTYNGTDVIYDLISFDSTAKNANGSKMAPSSISIEAVLVGDANDDGIVDISDVVAVQCYVANPTKYPLRNLRAADADGKDGITEADANMIQKYISQIILHF